jgi:DNA-binding CsgD family transcriptional regulator
MSAALRRPESPAAADRAPAKPLTPRELEILKHLSRGLTTRELGERLFISPVTVRNHIARIFAKLRVHNRLAAVAVAYDAGILESASVN